MRRAAKIDRNHVEIVAALRGVGASVQDLAAVGKGCPDLLVGYRGQNYVIEVKSFPIVDLLGPCKHFQCISFVCRSELGRQKLTKGDGRSVHVLYFCSV